MKNGHERVVLVSGGFDPIHSGHIEYLERAKELGDILVVAVNSDAWLGRKKGRAFMPWSERSRIVKALKPVGYTMEFNDTDGSAIDAIHKTRLMWPSATIVFANGGDRTKENIPEMEYKDDNIEFVFGVGGEDKKNSSSWILQDWKEPKTERPWGFYRVLYDTETTKVKELVVEPGKSLSMQKHTSRSEYWHVASGTGVLHEERANSAQVKDLYDNHNVTIPVGVWHQLKNNSDKPLKIIEIQYGKSCIEEDIERR
jgi:cytidyltransferase-like protein